MVSEADVGGTAVEAQHSPPPYRFTLLMCDRWQKRAGWQNGVWHGSVDEAVERNWTPPWGKNGTHWHSLTFVYVYGDQAMGMSTVGGGGCVSAVSTATAGHLCYCRFLPAEHAGSCSSLVKMHSRWWWVCWKIVFCSGELALSDSVIVLFLSIVISMEINRRRYFQSKLHMIPIT